MPLSRSPSFGDDDLEVLSSQAANMNIAEGSTQSPLRQIANPNIETIDLTDSPLGKPISRPVFGQPSQLQSPFVRKVDPNVAFIRRPANRPEHHRDLHRNSGPLKPKAAPKKEPYTQMFSSMSQQAQSSSQSSRGAFAEQTVYTDPSKAQADLKALLEGGMDEDDEEEGKEKKPEGEKETIEDGSVEGIKVKLLPHQVEGVQWMQGRETGAPKSQLRGKVPKGGILADDMGLGKTLQSISLIISNKMPTPEDKGWKKHFEQIKKATLVVAPLALIRQWEAEIKDKVTAEHMLKVCVHHGPQRSKDPRQLAKYDVVITTYQILVSEHGSSSPDASGLQAGCFGVHWFRVILDEAHSIKNRNAKATKAACALRSEYRWCLTGTPMQNNLDELQSLVKFLRIEPYDNLNHWREQIDMPMRNGRGHIAIKRLHTLLRCFMKRRTKEILKEEGALVAGGKKALDAAAAKAKKEGTEVKAPTSAFKITERKVVNVATQFSPAERKFYDQLEERADKSLERMIQGSSVNYANALVLLLRLRQACNHPRLAENKLDKDREALSADTAPPKAAGDGDIDDLADALGGMNIQTKRCDMCLEDLSRQEVTDGQMRCSACNQSIEELHEESPARKKSSKKSKRTSTVSKLVATQSKRRPQNRGRKILVDSDDEEEEEEAEGSWLVPEGEQGSLRLGKAGGEEDENAEGGGDDIDTESSISEDDEDGSQLDSFIVKDDSKVQDEDQSGVNTTAADSDSDEGRSDESFVSLSKIQSRVLQLQKKSRKSAAAARKLEESDSEESESEDGSVPASALASDSDDDAPYMRYAPLVTKGLYQASSVMKSAKIRELTKILKKEVHEHKFIVFSQFTSMMDLIEPFFLEQKGFKFVRYDGKMPNDQREAALHALRNDPHTRILLCSLKCGSLGLNLTAATRVVIVEPFWNPFVEEQAIDRVHRLTQKVDVVVYKLTVADTVEERILELQNKKRLLAEAAIEGGMRKDKNALKLGLAEIMELFKHDARAAKGTGRDFSDDAVVQQDVGEMVRSIKGMVGRKTERKEHAVYGRRW